MPVLAGTGAESSGNAVGIDVGGTKARGIVIDPSGNVLADRTIPTRLGPEGVLGTIVDLHALLVDAVPTASVTPVGVGIPGVVDPHNGVVAHAVNLRLTNMQLGIELERVLGTVVAVENDVNAAAVGAAAGSSKASLVYLNLGTGLAAGIVLDGELVRGRVGAAGELGHISIDPDGPLCGCGQRGCLEQSLSGTAVRSMMELAGATSIDELFDPLSGIVVPHRGRALLERLAWLVEVIALTIDVDRIVLGGGVVDAGDGLLEALRVQLRRRAELSPFIAKLRLADRIETSRRSGPVAPVGAAIGARRALDPRAS